MTRINIGAGRDDSARQVRIHVPGRQTGLSVDIGDAYDRSKLDATVEVRDPLQQADTTLHKRRAPSKATRGRSHAQTPYVRALLLLAAGLVLVVTFTIMAHNLPLILVPVVLVVSIAALYLFALFLVPSSNRAEVRSFGKVLGALIKAAFAKGTHLPKASY
jgi:hypothetical protein